MPADGASEALKRLRMTRKKIRQIDELIAAKHDGAELNADQEAKIELRPSLAKELALRTKQVEAERKEEAEGNAPANADAGPEDEAVEAPAAPVEETSWAIDDGSWGGGSTKWNAAPAMPAQPPKKVAPAKVHLQPPATPVEDDEWGDSQDMSLAAPAPAAPAAPAANANDGGVPSTAAIVEPQPPALQKQEPKPAQAPKLPAAATKPAVKKDQEAPYRKGWRGGSFGYRRIAGAHRSAIACVFVARGTAGGGRLVTGGYDNIAKVWDLETLLEQASLGGHTKPVTACFADSIYLATASDDGSVKYWTDGHCDTSLYCFSPVKCMTIIDDDLVTGHADGTVRVYEAGVGGTAAPRVMLRGHSGEVTSVRATNGGKNIVSTAKDSSCRVWDAEKGTLLHVLCDVQDKLNNTHCYAAAWLQDDKMILTTHDDGTCRAWTYPFTSSSRSILADQSCNDNEPLMHVEANGNCMALTRADGTIAGCDPRTLSYDYTLALEDIGGAAACLHSAGDVAAVGTFDGHVVVLDAVDERKIPKGKVLVACGPPVMGGGKGRKQVSPTKESESPEKAGKGKKKKKAGGAVEGGAGGGVSVDLAEDKMMWAKALVGVVVAVAVAVAWYLF